MYRYSDKSYVAGISTADDFKAWIVKGRPDTGSHFIRNLDGFDAGCQLLLGTDFSQVQYGLGPSRPDLISYYTETDMSKKEGADSGEAASGSQDSEGQTDK